MVRSQQGRKILSQPEVEGLKDEQEEIRGQIQNSEKFGTGTQADSIDKARLQARDRQIEEEIRRGQAPKVSGPEKDRLAKEVEELSTKLQVGMPTDFEMRYPQRCPGAIKKHQSWCARNQVNISRWVYIQKILNPEAPVSVESLRKEK